MAKQMSQSSEAILREQKQIRREQFFSNKGMIIGMVIFAVIVLSAVFIPWSMVWIPTSWTL